VVKIFVAKQRPSMAVPWQAQQVESSSGSGTLIRRRGGCEAGQDAGAAANGQAEGEPPYWHCVRVEDAVPEAAGDLVLTAAHVVADARDVRVQLLATSGASPDKFAARVLAIAHDCDLALLEVQDERCFEGAEPMEVCGPRELLAVQSRVQVMGFPIGGDYLSITEGVLSRVEVTDYSHGRRAALALTVDAAINAGNSGGPVVDPASGRLLAVAHQKVVAAGVENQGHCVPPCLIWRFLYGQARGRPASLPSLGVSIQPLESPAHREMVGLAEGETGALVKEVHRGPGEAESVLRAGDVLLQTGRYPVDNFAAVELLGYRVALSAVQDLHYIGDEVQLQVRRDGQDLELRAALRSAIHLVPRSLYGESCGMSTEFYICGGLVFVPLTADFLEQAWSSAKDRPPHLVDLYGRGVITPERSEVVILLSILADDVNAGHGSGYVGSPIVERVHGHPVADLADVVARLQQAVQEAEFVTVDFQMASGPYEVVLKSADIPEADERIQALYGLPSLGSLAPRAG